MSKVDELQERHDKLIAEIELAINSNLSASMAEDIIYLVHKYGNTCIKLVEAENEDCKGYGGTE